MTSTQNHNNNDLYDILPFDREHGVPKDEAKHEEIVMKTSHESSREVFNDHGENHDHSSHSHNDSHSDHNSHDSTVDESEEGGSKILKVLMVVGILVILFFISIGIVKVVPKAIGSLSSASVYLSSLFSKEGIELSIDKTKVSNNDTFTISWKNTSKKEGLLFWSFTCTEGVTVLYQSANGKLEPVICETSFPLSGNSASYPFTVKYSKDVDLKIPMTLSLFDKDTKDLIFSDTNQIVVTKVVTETEKKENIKLEENNTTYNPAKEVTSANTPNSNESLNTSKETNSSVKTTVLVEGPTDMSINLIQISAIEAGTFNVKNVTNVGPNDKVYIRFKVANLGTNKTGSWQITGLLPTLNQSDRAFVSKIQPSLNPSESHEMTMMFDSFDSTKNEIVLTIENTNDTVSSNNIIRIPISGSSTNTNNTNNSNTGSRADLSVRILDIGIIDRYNNFYRTTNISEDDEIAVKFEVENRGSESTGYYELEVKVPTSDNDSRVFRSLSPLGPGVRTEFTVKFDNADSGRGTISVEADPDNDIRENNENNNKATRSITIDR